VVLAIGHALTECFTALDPHHAVSAMLTSRVMTIYIGHLYYSECSVAERVANDEGP
jgi:hypothetical protein